MICSWKVSIKISKKVIPKVRIKGPLDRGETMFDINERKRVP